MTLKSNGPTINIEDPALEIHREKITKLLDKNKDMMAENFYELGKAKGIHHTIPTTGQIVYQRPRRQAKVLQKFIEKEVEDMLSCGIISPSTSPHNTPIHLAKKKDEGYLSEDNKIDDEDEIIELDYGLLGTTPGRILVPESLTENILKRFNDSPYAGHLGIKKTAARIQRRFKWPKMGKDIKEYVRGCEICAKRKAIGNQKTIRLMTKKKSLNWIMVS